MPTVAHHQLAAPKRNGQEEDERAKDALVCACRGPRRVRVRLEEVTRTINVDLRTVGDRLSLCPGCRRVDGPSYGVAYLGDFRSNSRSGRGEKAVDGIQDMPAILNEAPPGDL